MRLRSVLTVAMVAIAGCSSEGGTAAPTSSASARQSGAPSAAAAAPVTEDADAILQARLRETARNIDAIEAARGPGGLLADDFHWDANPPREPAAERGRPQVRTGEVTATGKLPAEIVKRIVRQNYGRFRQCYEDALEWDASVEGRLSVTFVIGEKGAVDDVNVFTDIKDPTLASCVKRGFAAIAFPQPESGVVKVTFPIVLAPGEAIAKRPGAGGLDGGIGTPSSPTSPSEPGLRRAEDQDWPIVVVEGDDVFLSGVAVAKTSALGEERRPGRVDELFEKMREVRFKWEIGHEMTKLPGVAGLRVSGKTPASVFKRVFQTMALAGYPTILVQSAEQPDVIVEMAAQLPILFASRDSEAAFERRNDPVFFLDVKPSETALVSRIEQRVVRTQKVDPRSELGAAVCQTWEKDGRYREPREARRDRLVLTGADELTTDAILSAARAALGCTRAQSHGGSEAKVPAVWVHFSAR